ncbi:AraC family transcriptional regulator [Chryseolinea lacunae]|uniref:AraC family transcriptional regulator n=1 Tax=Chryseolinea lacunae TaxID=2801331 RepID=A0ABS1KND8_9BACT|nr:AraC family transcriptional regulator [Chryseolinea lacunae]MBL0740964.1 AraC family transcriptional regulator [Chryseolinea lacunae]
MKVALQKSPISPNQAFEIKFLSDPHFDANWHFHPEYQLFVVLKGTGTRFIGDHVAPFREGDVVFTGPDLPHLWRSDPEYFEGNAALGTEGVVIYFHEDFLGSQLLEKNELYWIRQLFGKARQGMELVGNAGEHIKKQMLDLLTAKDFESILKLLNILHFMAHTSDYHLLSSEGYTNSLKESDTERMNRVHAYVMKNFRERISLEEVAAIANMTPSSFSRYFKTHANKTFSEFLTEIRIGYSCKLLIEKKLNISQACYESGFHTLSNFNRQFKAVTQHSPLEYKNKYNEVQRN